MAFHFSGIRLALLWLPHILMLRKCYKEEPKIDRLYSAAAVPFKKTTSTETLHCFPEPQQIRCFISDYFRHCWQAIKEWGFKRFFELPSVWKHGTFYSNLTFETGPRHTPSLDHFKVFYANLHFLAKPHTVKPNWLSWLEGKNLFVEHENLYFSPIKHAPWTPTDSGLLQ